MLMLILFYCHNYNGFLEFDLYFSRSRFLFLYVFLFLYLPHSIPFHFINFIHINSIKFHIPKCWVDSLITHWFSYIKFITTIGITISKKEYTQVNKRSWMYQSAATFIHSAHSFCHIAVIVSFVSFQPLSERKLFVDTSKRHIHDKCGYHSSSSHIVDAYLGARNAHIAPAGWVRNYRALFTRARARVKASERSPFFLLRYHFNASPHFAEYIRI